MNHSRSTFLFVLTTLVLFVLAGCGGSSTATGGTGVPPKKDPGASCADGGECLSGFCSQEPVGGGSVCSDCTVDADCPQATDTCEWNAVDGYSFCADATLAGLGDACAADTDCASGFCFDTGGGPGQICSTCSVGADCGAQRDCVYDPPLGFAFCVGTVALGDICQSGDQCYSGFCRGNVCSECERNTDCLGGGTCLDDMAGVGYFICSGGFGDTCNNGGDCGSGFCFDAGGGTGQVCSECEVPNDCGAQQNCNFSGADGYASCVGTSNFGDSCTTGAECVSGLCNTGVCSQCEINADCGGGTCIDDTAGVGFWLCTRVLGDACTTNAQCDSGFCFDPPGSGPLCSECEVAGDCGVQRDCVFSGAVGYASCIGIGNLGDTCTSGNQCVSTFCNGDVCSECQASVDCGGGTCFDDTTGVGYFVCTRPLGDACAIGAQCGSGFCFDEGGGIGQICSDCEIPIDCGAQQDCTFSGGAGYAVCIGTLALGDTCGTGSECMSDFCNATVCSECEGDTDCSGSCVDDLGGVGYFVCTFALGESCNAGSECESTYCFDTGFFPGMICSNCAIAGDCGNQQDCNYTFGNGYAVCEGIGQLGDGCADSTECESGTACNNSVCSDCGGDGDCGGGGSCIDDTAGAGYFVCARGLGDSCTVGGDCNSGSCFDAAGGTGMVCSDCATNGDCGAQRDCVFSFFDGYAGCVGTGVLGASCTDTNQCESGTSCNTGVCSECLINSDCGAAGTCQDDVAGVGYFVCIGGLGVACTIGADCGSGFCFDTPGQGGTCSMCEQNNDCSGPQNCDFNFGDVYARCVGNANPGDACTAGGDCDTGFCNTLLCSECEVDTDCFGGGTCFDDRAGAGYFICLSALGFPCFNDNQCNSGFCYMQGPGWQEVCSECANDNDCPNNTQCGYDFASAWARCN